MTTPDSTGAGGRKVAPFYTGKLGSGSVRFFLPMEDGERFPWPCLDDIIECAGLNRHDRRTAHVLLRMDDFPTVVVAAPQGLARISSMTMANSFISAMVHLKRFTTGFEGELGILSVAALDAMLPNMSDHDRLNYAIAARRNENGIPGPHPMIGARS